MTGPWRGWSRDWCCRPNASTVRWYTSRHAWVCLGDLVTKCRVRRLCEAHERWIDPPTNPYAHLHVSTCQPSACPACWWNAGWRPDHLDQG
jgi:hypothetical protein